MTAIKSHSSLLLMPAWLFSISRSSVTEQHSRHLPGSVSDLDMVKVWDSSTSTDGRGRSVYVLPAWYMIVDRSSHRLHAVDPPRYRSLAVAAAKVIAGRWKQSLMAKRVPTKKKGGRATGGPRRSSRQAEVTTPRVQLSQLLTKQ